MPENPTQRGDEQDPQEEESNLPASVIFMEMMRQAAARNQPPEADRPALIDDDIIEGEVTPVTARKAAARQAAAKLAAAQQVAAQQAADAEPLPPPTPLTPEER